MDAELRVAIPSGEAAEGAKVISRALDEMGNKADQNTAKLQEMTDALKASLGAINQDTTAMKTAFQR